METKKSRIIDIATNNRGEWASVDVKFENGDAGNQLIGKVSENKPVWFKDGDEVEYTIEARQGYPDKVKISRPQAEQRKSGGYAKGDEDAKIATMLVSYAKDLVVAGKFPTMESAATGVLMEYTRLVNILRSK